MLSRALDGLRYLFRASFWAAAALVFLLALAPAVLAKPGYAVGIKNNVHAGIAPLRVTFEIISFTQSGGRIVGAEFDPGDGSAAVQIGRNGYVRPAIRHTYTKPGQFTATVTIVTAEGERLSSRARITVRPKVEADPAELLQVTPTEGDAPLTVSVKIGAQSLPFAATSTRLSFGDGEAVDSAPGQTVSHVYRKAGTYTVRLQITGDFGNRARAKQTVTVAEKPKLSLIVAPTAGVAPLEVTVTATIPAGEVATAQVFLDGQPFFNAPGRKKQRFDAKGNHVFELRIVSSNGQTYSRSASVTVKEEDLSGYYEHDGGVVRITQSGGAFSGTMLAPTVAQAEQGYGIGTEMVRGAIADVAYSFLSPDNPDNPNSPTRRYYADQARQLTEGEYLIFYPKDCKPREIWGDYTFRADFGSDSRPSSLTGTVVYPPNTTVIEAYYRRIGEPMPRPGIVGRIEWVAKMIRMLQAAGITQGPEECIADDTQLASRSATFRRIGEKEARKLAKENAQNVRDFVRYAYDQAADGMPTAGGRGGDAEGGAIESADPVLLHSGEFFETLIDLGDAAGPVAWRFQRTYRSQSKVHTSLGYGWVHNYQLALAETASGWVFRGETGSSTLLRPIADGLFEAAGVRLHVTGDTRRLRTEDGTIYVFVPTPDTPADSMLTRIEGPDGKTLEFSYDLLGRLIGVTDPEGRIARYGYDAAGYLQSVTGPDRVGIALTHDSEGNLIEIVRVARDGQTIAAGSYRYRGGGEGVPLELIHNLTSVTYAGASGSQIDLAYGEDPAAEDFDRVVRQVTGGYEESFAYRAVEGGTETTLAATDRATEVHRFASSGQHLGVDYVTTDGLATSLASAEGPGSGLVGPTGRGTVTTEADGDSVIEQRPDAGSLLPPLVWLVRHEPIFGKVKAVWGPFPGSLPPEGPERDAGLKVTYIYDYEEAGLPPGAAEFVLTWDGTPLGDVNADRRTDQAAGRLIAATEDGKTTLYRWGDNGDPQTMVFADGAARQFTFAAGYLSTVSEVAPNGAAEIVARYDWDADGQLLAADDGQGTILTYGYDAFGRVADVLGSDGAHRAFVYDAADRIIEEWTLNPAGERSKRAAYVYDGLGHLTERRSFAPDGSESVDGYGYDAAGRVISASTPQGNWSRVLDPLGRVVEETRLDGDVWHFAYSPAGDLLSEGAADWTRTYEYEGYGRVSAEVDEAGTRSVYTYDQSGHLAAIATTDASGSPVVAAAAAADAATRVAPPAPARSDSVLTFDALGRVLGIAGPDGSAWALVWDGQSRPLMISRNGVTLDTFGYPEPGEIVHGRFGLASDTRAEIASGFTSRDGNGSMVVATFDAYDRPTALDTAGGSLGITIRRDAIGRVVEAVRGPVRWSRRFGLADDAIVVDQLAIADHPPLELERTVADGQVSSLKYPSGLAVKTSSVDARTALTIGGAEFVVTRDLSGAAVNVVRGSISLHYDRPVVGALESQFAARVTRDGAAVFDRTLFVINGVVSGWAAGDLVGTITRDAANRVATAEYEWPAADGTLALSTASFEYGPGGTPTAVQQGESAVALDVGALGQPQAVAGAPVTLDANGSVVAIANRSLALDPLGATATWSDGAATVALTRDALGAVVLVGGSENATSILRDGTRIVGVYRGAEALIEYVYEARGALIAAVVDKQTYLAVTGYDGSLLALIDDQGKPWRTFHYSPFGIPVATDATGNRVSIDFPQILFAGMLYDPVSGLYYAPQRTLDPVLGIFLSPDPLGGFGSHAPYLYALGDPFTYSDTTGAVSIPNDGSGKSTAPWPISVLVDLYNRATGRISHDVAEEIDRGGRPPPREENGDRTQPGIDLSRGGGSATRGAFDSSGGEAELRRERIAELNARLAARRAAVKRQLRFAEPVLPRSIVENWLRNDRRTPSDLLPAFYFDEWWPTIAGPTHVTGTDTANPLLSDVLNGRYAPIPSVSGTRVRSVFADLLTSEPRATNVTPPVDPGASPRHPDPTGANLPGGVNSPTGQGEAGQPRPGGLAGLLQ